MSCQAAGSIRVQIRREPTFASFFTVDCFRHDFNDMKLTTAMARSYRRLVHHDCMFHVYHYLTVSASLNTLASDRLG